MIDEEVQKMIDEADTMVQDGVVYMEAGIIEELARTIAAQHYMLMSTGSVDEDNERIQGQASIALILMHIVQAIASKHSEEIAAMKLEGVDLDKELGDLTQPNE